MIVRMTLPEPIAVRVDTLAEAALRPRRAQLLRRLVELGLAQAEQDPARLVAQPAKEGK